MPIISETTATLRFFGDDLDPNEVTLRLGSVPTDAIRKGDARTGKHKPDGSPLIARTGKWVRKVPAQKPGNLELQIDAILSGLTDDLAIWQDLSSRYKGNIFVGFFMAEGNEGYDLSPKTLKLLTDRGLALQLDIYDPPGADEGMSGP